jgi:hypothetical protein
VKILFRNYSNIFFLFRVNRYHRLIFCLHFLHAFADEAELGAAVWAHRAFMRLAVSLQAVMLLMEEGADGAGAGRVAFLRLMPWPGS